MADYFDSAQQGNDAAKAAMLDAIRTQGSQAKQAFDAAQATIAQQRSQAVAAALADANRAGAPQAMLDQVSQTVGTPFDRRAADLSSAAASRQSSFDQIGASGGKYFDEASAALPVLRTQQAAHTATLQEQLQEKLAAAQQAAQDRALSREVTLARLSKAQADQNTPAKSLAALGGANGLNGQLDQLVPITDAGFAVQRGGMAGPGNGPADAEGNAARQGQADHDYIEALGQHSGLAPGQASTIYATHLTTLGNRANTAANRADTEKQSDQSIGSSVGLSLDKVREVRTTSQYSNLQQAIKNFQSQGIDPGQIVTRVRGSKSYAGHPKTAEVALRDFLPPGALSNTYTGP